MKKACILLLAALLLCGTAACQTLAAGQAAPTASATEAPGAEATAQIKTVTPEQTETAAPEPAPSAKAEATKAPEMKTVRVSTVDEFLAAIAPNTEIILETGTYDVSAAKDYGAGGGQYYAWEAEEHAYPVIYDRLTIRNVDNLRITGGENVVLKHSSTNRTMLYLRSCSGFVLSGVKLQKGTVDTLIDLTECSNALIQSCEIERGSISADACTKLSVSDCIWHDAHLWIHACKEVTVSGCDMDACEPFAIDGSDDVLISACVLHDYRDADPIPGEPEGDASYLLWLGNPCKKLRIEDCEIYGNKCTFIFGLSFVADCTVSRVSIHDNDVGALFYYDWDTSEAPGTHAIEDCDIYGNKISSFLNAYDEKSAMTITLSGTSVRGNSIETLFHTCNGGRYVVSGCEFRENTIKSCICDEEGYVENSNGSVSDRDGKAIGEKELSAMVLERASGDLPAVTPAPTVTPEPAASEEPKPTATPAQKVSAAPSVFTFSGKAKPAKGVLFTCDLDGDGTVEEVTYQIKETYIRISVNGKSVDIKFSEPCKYAEGVKEAYLVDLDAKTPILNLVVVYVSSNEGDYDTIELHMKNGKLVKGKKLEGLCSLDKKKNRLIRYEWTDLFGSQEGERTYSGDSLKADSKWLKPTSAYRVTDKKLKNERDKLIEWGLLLHLVRDLPCTIDGKSDVIPAGSYIYIVRYHQSFTKVEISTEDGKTRATVAVEYDKNEYSFRIDDVYQDEYFDNITYSG